LNQQSYEGKSYIERDFIKTHILKFTAEILRT
jgi:hypothetical protein